ncbi:MAG: dihydroneopterin aldolase [Actinobacteria bacterium QS_5_72_10]|nr:MAG: dihydroneopterin aldolase [Actinobacteria bacterium QS_5_72_10]
MPAPTPADGDRDRIELCGLRCAGHHGADAAERAQAQLVVVDVTVHADLARAAVTDELADTVDYAGLAVRVAAAVGETSFALLEALADHLCAVVLADARVAAVAVRVAKPAAPMPVALDEVAVVAHRQRGEARP